MVTFSTQTRPYSMKITVKLASACHHLSIVGLLFVASSVYAQTAANPISSAAAKEPDQNVVTLNPFVVTGDMNGYTALRSLSGTRVAVDIKDIPFAIDIVPLALWADFGITPFGSNEMFATVPAVSPSENFGEYSTRGINTSRMLSDGFLRFGRVDPVNTERIEVVKGPAAAIYGYTLPGGVVNAIPKLPKANPEYSIGFAGGGLDYSRIDLNATGPLWKDKLLYRIGAARTHELGSQEARSNRMDSLGGQLLYKFTPDSSFRLDTEYIDEKRGAREGVLGAATEGYNAAKLPITLQDFGPAVIFPNFPRRTNSQPWGYSLFRNRSVDGTYVNQLNDTFTLRIAGDWRNYNLTTLRGSGKWDPITNRVWGRKPDFGYEHHYGHQLNASLLSRFNFWGIQHRLLTAFDYVRAVDEVGPTYYLDPTKYTVANGYPNLQNTKELDLSNPDYSVPPLGEFNQKYRDQIPTNIINGLMFSDQLTFFHDRVLLSVGGRYDSIRQVIDNLVTHAHQEAKLSKSTVQSGLNFRLNSRVTLYGSYSTSFQPQTVLDDAGNAFPPQLGKGYDAGFKTSLLAGDQLFLTLGYFELTHENIVESQVVDNRTVNLLSGKLGSHGVEFSLGGVVAKALTIKMGMGYTDAKILTNKNTPILQGLPPRAVAKWNGGMAVKYDFRKGRIKGAYVGTNVNYLSKARYNNSNVSTLVHFYLPGWTKVDFSTGYGWRSANQKYNQAVGLVLKNAFDRFYMFGNNPTVGNPRQLIGQYSLSFK
jgi:iron complex outermembrane recepter protein